MIRFPKQPIFIVPILVLICTGVASSKSGLKTFVENYEEINRDLVEKFDSRGRKIVINDNDELFEIESCSSFIDRVRLKGFDFSGISAGDVGDLLPCMIWGVLSEAGPARNSFFDDDSQLGRVIFADLDISTFRSSLRPRLSSKRRRFSDLFSSGIKIFDQSFTIEDEYSYYKMEVIAKADFDDDGIEDLLSLFHDDNKQGSYFLMKPLILKKAYNGGKITAHSWDEVLTSKK